MPLALLSGILIVSIVYFLINIAYFVVLDVETIKSSNAVAAVLLFFLIVINFFIRT